MAMPLLLCAIVPVLHFYTCTESAQQPCGLPGPAAMAVTRPTEMVPDGTHDEPDEAQEPALPGQIGVHSFGPQIPAHQVHASPFQAISMDRSHSWDEPHNRRPIALDSAGNEQAPGAHRQFSLELTTYASIPVRNMKSGFRPPHRLGSKASEHSADSEQTCLCL